MKYLILMILFVGFLSCDNELDLVADNREVPVVYALIDQSDTAQYIRVERVFVDKQISGNVIAQNPDSLYYEDITVKLVRTLSGAEYTLQRVDGNLEGYVREEGVFASAPNYLYKIKTEEIPLIQNEEIQLRIEGVYEDRAITSTAFIIEPPFLLNPMTDGLISILPKKTINIGWTPKGDAEIYSAIFFMNVDETKAGVTTRKRLTWIVTKNTDKTVLEASGTDFFSFLVGALEKNTSITRRLRSIEFELISGNSSIADYIRVGEANLGITSSGEIPVFTNISEGLGIFGTTHTHRRTNIDLAPNSLDSLINSQITKDLNFK